LFNHITTIFSLFRGDVHVGVYVGSFFIDLVERNRRRSRRGSRKRSRRRSRRSTHAFRYTGEPKPNVCLFCLLLALIGTVKEGENCFVKSYIP
jgi:hypothetical protein